MASRVTVRLAEAADRDWVVEAARRLLGSEHQVHSRRQFTVDAHDLLIADVADDPRGFLTWVIDDDGCEVLAIATDRPRSGVGRSLIDTVADIARDQGCRRIHLTTTDRNVGAQRFYEAVGFTLAERLVGAVDLCRERWKPEIPLDAHDELVYERVIR